jgi:hypothetical protein
MRATSRSSGSRWEDSDSARSTSTAFGDRSDGVARLDGIRRTDERLWGSCRPRTLAWPRGSCAEPPRDIAEADPEVLRSARARLEIILGRLKNPRALPSVGSVYRSNQAEAKPALAEDLPGSTMSILRGISFKALTPGNDAPRTGSTPWRSWTPGVAGSRACRGLSSRSCPWKRSYPATRPAAGRTGLSPARPRARPASPP